jgi:glycine cleavage system regulatory protein
MQRSLVMTLIAPDRPGLVESIAAAVAENGGNWLESRMSRLGGQFVGLLRVEVPPDHESNLIGALNRLESGGLHLVVHSDKPLPSNQGAELSSLEIVGQDRPGIVKEISRTLAGHGVNVEELETECSSAAMTGETLFRARATLHIPDSCDRASLQRELERIAADLIVDISLADLGEASSKQ